MLINYNNNLYEVDIEIKNDETILNVNGEKTLFKTTKLTDRTFAIYQDTKKMISHTAMDDNHFYVNIDGNTYQFDLVKDEEKSFDGNGKSTSNKDVIKPPMPGSIVKVLVSEGQKVSDGDSLVIIEAMKMETTIFASISGVVSEVNVIAGEQVDADKVLMVIDKEVAQV